MTNTAMTNTVITETVISETVSAWAETIVIPTYRVGAPNRNPMFLEKRVYQGSSGVVYPLPVIDEVHDEKSPYEYTALFLENRYLKIMILPELGGRVQMALDKTNNYHFVYYNRVIKPALVGLAGPWLSGGIEFNWPQHHRPTTFMPVDWCIAENNDGSRTVWCAEIDPMFHTKGMHGFTMRHNSAVLEVSAKLYNRTDTPQTFLWWANPAVAVSDDYQTVFPPDVTAVMDHGKRDVSTFPIATGVYYKHDYSPGRDIRWYKNIPVPTSYMAHRSEFDFVGGYDHGREAGMLHVADHRFVPGKKMWTWGAGDFGEAWNRHLTDEDGPYIELMCGAFTDNQPDFSWIQPGEERRFKQYFLPYKTIGPPQNASTEVVLHLEVDGGEADLGVYVTSPRRVHVCLMLDDVALYAREHDLSPERALRSHVTLPDGVLPASLRLEAWDGERVLLACRAQVARESEIPSPATAAPEPKYISTNEELYLHGLHLEQYRHATYSPEEYYGEALRRDPLDARANNALGLIHYQRGEFAAAEAHFRIAIERLTFRNPNPRDGEPFYNLGLALRMQGKWGEASEAFAKAMWSHAWVAAGALEVARLASRAGDITRALEFLDQALASNISHHRARHLRIALLRRTGNVMSARSGVEEALALDPLEYGALHEARLLGIAVGDAGNVSVQDAPVAATARAGIELALDYAHAGLFAEAMDLLGQGNEPLQHYLSGWVHLQTGDVESARGCFQRGAVSLPDFCFPNRLEEMLALEAALRLDPTDWLAAWALGNFYYGHRRHDDAIAQWENSCAQNPNFATAQRNLGFSYANRAGDLERALAPYERACVLDPYDARLIFELDQLRRRLNIPPAIRLQTLAPYRDLVLTRDDLAIEYVTLLNLTGAFDEALQILAGRNFHPWEGGEGKVTRQYTYALSALAREALGSHDNARAITLLQAAQERPRNLGEGKLEGARENDIHYLLGCACRAAGESARAEEHFALACVGASEPMFALAYYDQPPEMIFYQGLALRALGREDEATARFTALLDYGVAHENDDVRVDYFAVSLPESSLFEEPIDLRYRLHCHYMAALGVLGLGDQTGAHATLERILALDASHQGATLHRQWKPLDERPATI